MKKKIFFNKPFINKAARHNILKVIKNMNFTDGIFQKKCENYIKKKIKSSSVKLTNSCTSALEIAMILINLKKGDEVIIPSYTFTSTANCIIMRGAKPVFIDINSHDLNMSAEEIEKNITKKTKAIIVVHYAGVSCDLDKIIKIKNKYNLFLIEDAAHAFMGKYKNQFLGTIGDLGAFSFHETKNIVAGQGGALSINNKRFEKRAKIILDKGTDKSISYNKKKYYSWKGMGSEYRAPELTAAFLYSQLTCSNKIQKERKKIFDYYYEKLKKIDSNKFYTLKKNIKNKKSAYHIFPVVFQNLKIRKNFINYMKKNNVECYFHYYPLHLSSFGKKISNLKLKVTEMIYDGLVRLPLYPELNKKEQDVIIKLFKSFINKFKNI